MANNTDWLNLSPMSGGTGQTNLSLTALTNTGLTQKFAVVTAYNERYNVQDATIVRIEGFQPTLTLSRSTLRFDSTGGTATFTVYSNTAWTIQFPSIVTSYSTSAGTGDTEVTIALGENIEQVAKIETGYVEDVYGVNRLPLTVVQEALVVFLEVEPDDDIVFDPTGSLTAITITSNADWEILANSWITPSVLTGGSGTTTVILSAGPNTEEYREGTVSVISGSKYVIMKATQDVHIDPYLTVAPTELVFSYSGENQYIFVGSYPEWTAEIVSTGQTHWGVDIGASAVFETDSPNTTVDLGMGGAIVNGVVVRGTTYTFPEAGRYTVQYPYTGSTAPSFQNNQHITEVSFTNLIDTLPDSVFSNCPNLTSVTIPETVTSIGYRAFKDCTALESFVFPDTVATIGAECFRGCTALTSVTLPQSLTFIDNNFFSGCTSLPELAIPGSVTGLGDSLFYDCSSLLSISAYGETAAIFKTSGTRDAGTFYGMATGGTLYHNIGTDYSSWFQGHPSLETVHWIDCEDLLWGDLLFSPSAFTRDICSGSTEVLIGAKNAWVVSSSDSWISLSQPSGGSGITPVTVTVSEYSYSGGEHTPRVGTLVITDGVNNATLTVTQEDYLRVTAVFSIPANNLTARVYGNRASDFRSITLSDGTVVNAQDYKFPASGLQTVYYYLTGVTLPRYSLNQVQRMVDLVLPYGLTSVEERGVYQSIRLTSLTLSDTISNIGPSAFTVAEALTNLVIPDSVATLGTKAFSGCRSLTSITIGSGVTSWGASVFEECVGLESLTLRNGLTAIGNNAFKNTTNLTSVTIPESVQDIGDSAFSLSGVSGGLREITIPDTVLTIGEGVFAFSSLSSVTIGSGLTAVSSEAFRGCSKLTSLTIPDTVTAIGSAAFKSCTSLEEITLPTGLTSLSYMLFWGCESLENITIPGNVLTIGGEAFAGCSGLTGVSLSTGLTSLGDYCFNLCSGLTSITLPDSLTDIGLACFKDCSSLSRMVIPDGVAEIKNACFSGCSSLSSLTLGSGVTKVSDYYYPDPNEATTFSRCYSLTAIYSKALTAPVIETRTFSGVGSNGNLFYPQGSDYSAWLNNLSGKNWTGREIIF